MVLDIDFFRTEKGGDPELIRLSEIQRFRDGSLVDTVVNTDGDWRKARFKVDHLKKLKNLCGKTINEKIKKTILHAGSLNETLSEGIKNISINSIDQKKLQECSISEIKHISSQIDVEIIQVQEKEKELLSMRDGALREVGNILHSEVPISNDENDNAVIRTFGDLKTTKPLSHIELCDKVGGVDLERGIKVGGGRNYFLKGPLVFLEQALINLSMRILAEKDYTALYTPFMMRRDVMQEVAQLSQFHEELYKLSALKQNWNNDLVIRETYHFREDLILAKLSKPIVRQVTEKSELDQSEEEKYLIATSEQPIAAYHRGEWLSPEQLPIKYCGLSTCFRQEVGSHGKDTRGIFRVHQFEKIEQFCITTPENNESWVLFHDMIANSETLYKLLNIPYRIVSIVSGDLNNAAAMKYDLEAWFPGSQKFRELVSCSNCTDYQSRSLRIRFGQTRKLNENTSFVHMLNCTMCATTRTICVILETYQTDDGILIPEALQPYMPDRYKTRIPFVGLESTQNGAKK